MSVSACGGNEIGIAFQMSAGSGSTSSAAFNGRANLFLSHLSTCFRRVLVIRNRYLKDEEFEGRSFSKNSKRGSDGESSPRNSEWGMGS